MSQKVRIIKVKHTGASVYLGDDSYRNRRWTRNPERIMDWLCDGWRTRFNQHREHRTTRRYMEDVESHERMWVDVPLGGATVGEPFKDSKARTRCSWLACIPAAILGFFGLFILFVDSVSYGVGLLVIAFLISPYGLPMLAGWLVAKLHVLRYAIQDWIYG